jgi:small-conductance mechanosensitive channel
MADELKTLAQLRKLSSETKDAIKQLEKVLEETPAYQRLVEAKESLKEYESKADEITTEIKTSRTAMIEEQTKLLSKEERAAVYAEFKEKLPVGLGLRINHSLKYDEQEAIKWCEINAKTAIKTVLDKKPFEALAEASDLAFVEKIDTPTITIATDLSGYLD